MANGLRLITSNPSISGFDNRRQQQDRSATSRLARDRNVFDLEQKQLGARREQARDTALSRVVSTPGKPDASGKVPSVGARGATALANIGQGTEAFKLSQGEATRSQARSDQAFDQMATLLGQDRPDAALVVAKNAGVKITPTMQSAFGNATFRRGFDQSFKRNKAAFKDARQFEKQMQLDMMQLLGQIQQTQPGQPTPAGAGAPRLTPSLATSTSGQATGAPFEDRSGNLFVRDKAGNTIPLRSGGTQLRGPERKDPNAISAVSRANLEQKFFETLNETNFLLPEPLSNEQLREQARGLADQALRTNPQAGGQGSDIPQGEQELPPTSSFFDVGAGQQQGPRVQQPQQQQAQPVPRDPRQRVPGTVYHTPRGPLRWTGVPGQEWSRR